MKRAWDDDHVYLNCNGRIRRHASMKIHTVRDAYNFLYSKEKNIQIILGTDEDTASRIANRYAISETWLYFNKMKSGSDQ